MRLFKAIAPAIAILSMASAPALANSAASLSVSKSVRANTSAAESNELAAGFGGVLAAVIVVGVLAIAVLAGTKDDTPDSP